MKYLIIPKEVLSEKLSNLEISIDRLKEYDRDSIGGAFRDIFKIHYKDFKELENYTLVPPSFDITGEISKMIEKIGKYGF